MNSATDYCPALVLLVLVLVLVLVLELELELDLELMPLVAAAFRLQAAARRSSS